MKGIDILTIEEGKLWTKVDYSDEDLIINDLIELVFATIADSIDDFEVKVLNDRFKIKLKYCMSCSLVDTYENRKATTDKKEQLTLINQNTLLQLKYSKYE